MTELGQAKLIGHVCRIVAGQGQTIEDLKRKAAAISTTPHGSAVSSGSTAAARKVKLSSVISQIDDTEILLADEKEILKAFARFEVVYGKGERIPKESEPTSEQITAVKHLLDQGSVPYVDFAIFGPYGMHILKKVKLSGVMLGRGWICEEPRVSWSSEHFALDCILHGSAKCPSDVGRCGSWKSTSLQGTR